MSMIHNADNSSFKPWSDKQVTRMAATAISRREAVQRTLLGAAGLVLGHHVNLRALAATPSPKARAKSVIQIWMWGPRTSRR